MNLSQFLEKIPKVELHLHIEAVASYQTIRTLNNKYKAIEGLDSEDDFRSFLSIDNLNNMIKKFLEFQTLYREREDYFLLIRDLESYLVDNKIGYAEVFVSPSMVRQQGFVEVPDLYDTLSEGFKDLNERRGIEVKLIVDLSRSFGTQNARENLENLVDYTKHRKGHPIVGVGLGGKEEGNPASDYKKVFKAAREFGFHVVAHAGEDVPSDSIRQALFDLKAERIGHGTSAVYDEELMDFLKKHRIPLEICLTSNILTGKYAKTYAEHPVKTFIGKGVPITINTDDPVMFNTDLKKEYEVLVTECGLTLIDMINVMKTSLQATFWEDFKKKSYWEQLILPVIEEHLDDIRSNTWD